MSSPRQRHQLVHRQDDDDESDHAVVVVGEREMIDDLATEGLVVDEETITEEKLQNLYSLYQQFKDPAISAQLAELMPKIISDLDEFGQFLREIIKDDALYKAEIKELQQRVVDFASEFMKNNNLRELHLVEEDTGKIYSIKHLTRNLIDAAKPSPSIRNCLGWTLFVLFVILCILGYRYADSYSQSNVASLSAEITRTLLNGKRSFEFDLRVHNEQSMWQLAFEDQIYTKLNQTIHFETFQEASTKIDLYSAMGVNVTAFVWPQRPAGLPLATDLGEDGIFTRRNLVGVMHQVTETAFEMIIWSFEGAAALKGGFESALLAAGSTVIEKIHSSILREASATEEMMKIASSDTKALFLHYERLKYVHDVYARNMTKVVGFLTGSGGGSILAISFGLAKLFGWMGGALTRFQPKPQPTPDYEQPAALTSQPPQDYEQPAARTSQPPQDYENPIKPHVPSRSSSRRRIQRQSHQAVYSDRTQD